MKDLNSVLLEGEIARRPRRVKRPQENPYYLLRIKSVSPIQGESDPSDEQTRVSHYSVELSPAFAEKLLGQLTEGTRIRVIGKLTIRGKTVRIQSEHAEIRPPRVSAA